MTYKRQSSRSSFSDKPSKSRKSSSDDPERSSEATRGAGATRSRGQTTKRARGAERGGGLRRSSRVKQRYRASNEEQAEDEETEEEEEEVILSSQPSSSAKSQSTSSTQQSTHRSSPIIIDSTETQDIIIRRSRSSTPIIPLTEDADITSPPSSTKVQSVQTPVTTLAATSASTAPPPPPSNRVESMLMKQGKQIIALYELQKKIIEKIDNIQDQLKKIIRNKSTELSPKIFSEGYNSVCNQFFPANLWPNFEEYKTAMKNWLQANHQNYLDDIGEREWSNAFSGKHHSAIMRKMKDVRGTSVAAVRNALNKTFSVQFSSSKGRRNSNEFIEWKNSQEVANCHKRIFSTSKSALETLTVAAFPSSQDLDEPKFEDYYVYTAAVCDIILNPKYQAPDVTKKPLELRLRKFKERTGNRVKLEDCDAVIQEERTAGKKKSSFQDDDEEEEVEQHDEYESLDKLFD